MAQNQRLDNQHEFLPLCDVLFNIISLASYFCDVVFDLAMAYALARHTSAPSALFPTNVALVVTALLISQTVSLRWYLWGARGKLTGGTATIDGQDSRRKKNCVGWTVWCVVLLHSTQIGVLWRYFKLFIPVDLAYVKHEVRELCVLRLIHAFCEAAPMLLLQLYLLSIGIGNENGSKEIKLERLRQDGDKLAELTAVSAGLSLWSVCWAVASFSKGAARLRNLERLVLTWLGVLAQLAWRLGTVSARVGALVAYASLYGGQWLLVVMALHWLSMLTWLILTPDGLFHDSEKLTFSRKTFLASLLAFVYVFAYVNLHETNHRQKMIIFYTVMFLENSLLVGVWAVGVDGSDLRTFRPIYPRPIILLLILFALFFGGLFFMGLYYRYFHVRRLRYEAGGRMNGGNVATTLANQDITDDKQIEYGEEKKKTFAKGTRKVKLTNGGIPGVFNCRFANPTVTNLNRKKKKPTTFVPPPVQQTITTIGETKQWTNCSGNTRQLIPFWKRPLSASTQQADEWAASKNEIDLAVGSLNVNLIREKLREKKQQQLRELRAIQEEIKEGKLVPPPSASTSSFSSSLSATNQRSPPNTKLHTSPNSPLSGSPAPFTEANNGGGGGGGVTLTSWPPIKMHCLLPPTPSSPYHPTCHSAGYIWRGSQRDRADTPEILLAPRCLPHHFPHWTPTGHKLRSCRHDAAEDESSKGEGGGEAGDGGEGEVSDIEGSQISLPRSYTLPREFKYNNGNNPLRERRAGVASKLQPSRFYLPSTNSSDGDVDSADNEEETDSELQRARGCGGLAGGGEETLHVRCDSYEGGGGGGGCGESIDSPKSDANLASTPISPQQSCYIINSFGPLRPNQLLRAKVKHETKL